LLFAHATGFHGRVWAPLAGHLARWFRCISFDQRGHGESGRRPGEDFDWRGFAADVLAVVDGCRLGTPAAVGHSCGATALLMGEERRPGTFAALYCFEPVVPAADPPLGPDPDNWLAVAARRRRAVFPSRDDALAHYASRAVFAGLDPEVLGEYVEHGLRAAEDGSVSLKCRPQDEARAYQMGSAHDCYAHLAAVQCAVTLACGEMTDAVGPAALRALAARLRGAGTEVLPGLGHLGPLEDPEGVAHSILRSLAPARGKEAGEAQGFGERRGLGSAVEPGATVEERP